MGQITDDVLIANATGKGTDTAIPQFFMKDKKNNFKSNETGHTVYDRKEYVRIIVPGDRYSIPEREITDKDRMRWPRQYAMWKQGLEVGHEGTLIENYAPVDRNQAEFLKHWNVHTVEQLAALNDAQCQRMGMGMMNLRSGAALWLEQARNGSGLSRIKQERDELKSKVDVLTEQLADLSARMNAMAQGEAPAVAAPQADLMQAMLEKMAAMEARLNAAPVVGAAPKRTRRTKAEMEAARAAEADGQE